MRSTIALGVALVACSPAPDAAPTLDPAAYTLVDLTHPFNAQTIYWPTSTKTFEHPQQAFGPSPGGWFYSSYELSTPEHGGTHLDAPIHFGEGKQDAAAVPVERLVAPAVVIDVRRQAGADPDYRLAPEDLAAFEREHGRIPAGAIVLLRTGWSSRWGDRKAYFGDDTPGDATKLHFPGYGETAARVLVEERQVAALGIDSPSVDYGPSQDFPVHRLGAPRGVPNFENLTNLDRLPPTGAFVVALPMKIEGGSGAPLRAVALVRGER